MVCDFIYSVCTCWCMWVKKEYVKSALRRHLYTQFFYFFGKFFILKMIHNPFKVPVQCNHITEIITTSNHNLLGHLCYTPHPLNNSFPPLYIGEAGRSIQAICSHSMDFSWYTHCIQMVQEVSWKTLTKFPAALDIYWGTVYR